MKEDELIQEIRNTREELAKSFNYDLQAISNYFLNQEMEMRNLGLKFAEPRKNEYVIESKLSKI
jgi:hypothetical protein